MKPVLLIRNDDRYESFGLAPGALARVSVDVRTANVSDPSVELPALDEVSGVVTFGGTMNVDRIDAHPHLGRVREYTRRAVAASVPYLGICLGSQILARASGVEVDRARIREVGFEPVTPTDLAADDPILSVLGPEEMVLQWHEDTHELPDGATLLATSGRIPVQAYRIGIAAWGVQFHLEVDASELAWWLEVADAEVDLKGEWGKSAEEIRAEAATHMARQEERGRAMFAAFADVVRGAA